MKYRSLLFACESIPRYKLDAVRKKRLVLAQAGVVPSKFPIIILESHEPSAFDRSACPPKLLERAAASPFPSGEYLSFSLALFSATVPVFLCNTGSKKSMALMARLQTYCLDRHLSYFTCLY